MSTKTPLSQSRLSIVLFESENSTLLKRVPVYAEMNVSAQLPPYVIHEQPDFFEEIETPLRKWVAAHSTVVSSVNKAIAENIAEKDFNSISDKHALYVSIIQKIKDNFDEKDTAANKEQVIKKIVLQILKNSTIEINQQPNSTTLYSFPLGTLASDHAGYLSYDISSAVNQYNHLLEDKTLISASYRFLIYPFGREEAKIDITSQSRFTPNVIFGKVFLPDPSLLRPVITPGLPAMQNPSLDDWYLSPSSFALNPSFFIGADGCENLYPANFATQEFSFYQVIRGNTTLVPGVTKPDGQGHSQVTQEVLSGWTLEYRVTWQPLGHTIGQIVYSLPLAPGEIVKIAIIDWSRKSTDSRDEDTTVKEQLSHTTHRDRNISETVDAAMQEWQRGGSFMGGVSGSYGAGGYGLSGALGGGYSTSSGSRNIQASTTQQISDAFAQASSSMRELRSTVVVQSDQQEHAKAEGRVIANHNHSHALTMLYYEILRHYKVATQFMRYRPSILVQYPDENFQNIDNIVRRRLVLEPVLLDPKLAGCFDAIQKLQCLTGEFNRKKEQLALQPNLNDVNELGDIKLVIKTKSATERYPHIYILTKSRERIKCLVSDPKPKIPNPATDATLPNFVEDDGTGVMIGETTTITSFINYRQAGQENVFTVRPFRKVLWNDVDSLQVEVLKEEVGSTGGNANPWVIEALQARTTAGAVTWVMLNLTAVITVQMDAHQDLTVQPYKEIPKDPSDLLSEEERCCVRRLMNHLSDNGSHYKKAIWLMEDSNERAKRFRSIKSGASALLDLIDNRPIDVYGDYVVFPARKFVEENDELNLLESIPLEKLMTLPTRGVFGEAKLGHCNASEEIDNTRFWDWQTSPIPDETPGIDNLNINASRNDTPSLAPTTFPASIVNIVNPSSLPDPTAMNAAMSALSKPDIFRDMSVSNQVEDLLKSLANNSVTMGQASSKAGDIMQQRGANSSTPTQGSGTSGGGTVARPSAEEQHNQLQVLRNAAAKGDITTEQKKQLAQTYLADATKPATSTLAFGLDAGTADAAAAGQTAELPPVAAPTPIAFPPVSALPPPDKHPPLMQTCPANDYFGDPPNRNQKTRGKILPAAEIVKRTADIQTAIGLSKTLRPLSAANLQHWLDGTGKEMVMTASTFLNPDSGTPAFLQTTARKKFENGCLDRLKNASHPQGTLLPAKKVVGTKGPIRFMQFRDGVKPIVGTTFGDDLFTSVGSFFVHSAVWVQATYTGQSGSVFKDDMFDVQILRWCVQVYDVYDWNNGSSTPFPLTAAQFKLMQLPAGAANVVQFGSMVLVTLNDDYFADLEVSGKGRAFLVRSETFEAPANVRTNFNFKI